MSIQLQEYVALVTYANMYLQSVNLDVDIDRLASHNCPRLEFLQSSSKDMAGTSSVIASDATKWFAYLKKQNAKRVKLHYQPSSHPDLPDHIGAAFVGGGSRWFLEVQNEENCDLYSIGGDDKVTPSRPGKKPYVLLEKDLDFLQDSSLTVSKSRQRLNRVLKGLISFAKRFEHTQHWAGNFSNSRATLTEFEPSEADDLIPYGVYPKETRQLIETAFRSWVFGGMGSWNDLAFGGDDQSEYHLLSEELYEALCTAVVSGVNSFGQ